MVESNVCKSEMVLKTGTSELEIITLYLRWIEPAGGKLIQSAYGINAAKVRELVALPSNIVAVPDSPPAVKGVFLLRDRTIPLVDLCEWFGYQADTSDKTKEGTVVVVTEINGKVFAFVTHGVDKVHRVSWKDVKPPPEIIAEQSSITGVCLLNGAIVQMIDFEKIIASVEPASDVTAASGGGSKGKKVLVAEDSRTARGQLVSVLNDAGYEVVAHPDGQSCWEWLEAAREQGAVLEEIAGVVTDIEMPRMDGLHLCALIKNQPAYQNLPVMLFSSLINDTIRHKAESAGADDQISKSELGHLVARFEACLARVAH